MKPYFGEKIFRAFPLLIYIKLLVAAILFNETHAIVFACFLFACDVLNHGLKILLKSICPSPGDLNLPGRSIQS